MVCNAFRSGGGAGSWSAASRAAMADVSASLRGMRRLSCMAATGSRRCRLLLQDFQGPEERASADPKHGGQFTDRLTLLIQAQ